jgi:serine/threonine protein kinase/tetratricopeptide (TPR) repeat protein
VIGATVGQYTVLDKIGRGAMGEVYLAIDKSLNRKIALKILTSSESTASTRFLSEARMAASIEHPFVCKIYEAGEYEGNSYISMEFIEGRTLSDELKKNGALAFRDCLRLTNEICEALIAAHARGVIHRDLKPANIMVAVSGHIKVLDFGLAKRILATPDDDTVSAQTLTAPGTVVGITAYMSPEQLLGRPLDARSDIFALGIIFYQMATGRHPFRKAAAIETSFAIVNEAAVPVRQVDPLIPEAFERVIARMLSKDPKDRYASVEAVRTDLEWSQSVSVAPPRAEFSGLPIVAVRPFDNLSADPEQEYFSEGITEDIVSKLCKLTVIQVIGPRSVRRFKDRDRAAAQIGMELHATHVLEGSVRSAGARVRISVSLIEVKSSRQVWGDSYDGNLDDVFAIQNEVAERCDGALQETFSSRAVRRSKEALPNDSANVAAYQMYLKGRYFLNRISPANLIKAIHYFEQAIDAAPGYARAYAGLSTCYETQAHYGFISSAEGFPKARRNALLAIELDDQIAEPHASLGGVKFYYEWDWVGAEACFQRALEADQNCVDAHMRYSSWLLGVRQDFASAIVHAKLALELDPLSPFANTNAGFVLSMAGHANEGIEYFDRALEIDPAFPLAGPARAMAYSAMGRHDDAIEQLKTWSWSKALLGHAYGMAGRIEEALEIARELSQPDSQVPARPSEIALIWLFAGEREKAREWLERAFVARDYMLAILVCPIWFPLRDDALIQEALGRMGLTRGSTGRADAAES